jgi:MFS transporter, OFA family, oxalate/formate antiporter
MPPEIPMAQAISIKDKRHKVFYGWWIVGALFLISVYDYGAINYGFTAMFEPISQEFGWSYTQISFAASLRGAEAGIIAPIAGILVDRWGPRRLLLIGGFINGLGLILLSRIESIGMFYTAFILISMGMSASTNTVPITAVVNWFRKKVSIATGIMVSGSGLGGLMIPVIVLLIMKFGWRTSVLFMGLGCWAITMPLSLLVRHKPEQYGYLPDGEAAGAETAAKKTSPAKANEADIGARQALRSRTFLHIALVFMYSSFIITAVTTHVMPYLDSVGIARSTSGILAGVVPVASIGGRLGFGWLGDRYNKKVITALGLALLFSGLLLFSGVSIGGLWFLLPSLILFGFGYGNSVVMTPNMIREYFGTKRFGTVIGFTMGAITIGGIGGPPLAGWVFDTWGSYQGAWLGFAALSMVTAVILLTTPRMGNAIQTAHKT